MIFDFISPLVQMGQEVLGGLQPIRFQIPPGWSGRQVERYLRRQGIRVGRGSGFRTRGEAVIVCSEPDRALQLIGGLW